MFFQRIEITDHHNKNLSAYSKTIHLTNDILGIDQMIIYLHSYKFDFPIISGVLYYCLKNQNTQICGDTMIFHSNIRRFVYASSSTDPPFDHPNLIIETEDSTKDFSRTYEYWRLIDEIELLLFNVPII